MAQSERLAFNKAIISTPQHPIKDLLKRVQQLSEELSTTDQETVDLSSFHRIKDDLVNPKLLLSANTAIQAHVCCAVADILRLYAPEAPFTPGQISSIFRAFYNQFKKLSDPQNPQFHQQCYLLKRLAEVRSIILITDVQDAEDLIERAFNVFYDLANKEIPQRLEPLISDILSDIMSEAEVVPHNVLKLILDRLLTKESGIMSSANVSNPGFNFSVNICESNVDRMSRQVAQYFSELLYENSKNIDANGSKAMEVLKRIHKLSIQIWQYVPGLLTTVMGLINEELHADDETIRMLATETIGTMLGSLSPQNFIINYKDTWSNWLKKSMDISANVRCKWAEQISAIVNNSETLTTEAVKELCSDLNNCLLDSDEKVRLMSCISLDKISFDRFTKTLTKDTMVILTQLIREKNTDIRHQAINILSNQWNQLLKETRAGNVIDFGGRDELEMGESVFSQIPNDLLSLIYINDKEINSTLDIAFFEKLMPFESDTKDRVNRLCHLFANLNKKSQQSFFAINSRQQKIGGVLSKFVALCEQYGSVGSLSEDKENVSNAKDSLEERQKVVTKLDKVVKWLCESMPERYNSNDCLERFYKLKNFRLLHLVKLCISPDSEFTVVKSSIKELLSKISNPKTIKLDDGKSVSVSDMVSTFKLLLYRSALIVYNKSNIIELINNSKSSEPSKAHTANELLTNISITVPDVLKNSMNPLIEMCLDEDIAAVSRVNHLRTIYHIVKKFPELAPSANNFGNLMEKLCIEGSPYEAKYAMKLIRYLPKSDLYCTEIVDKIYPLDLESSNFATHVSTVAEMFLACPSFLEDKANEITAFLIKDVLLKNKHHDDETKIWISDRDLLEHYQDHEDVITKIHALRAFTNRLRSLSSESTNVTKLSEICKPIFKLLITIITNGGEIVKDENTPSNHKLRLRLLSATSLIKIGKCEKFVESFNPEVLGKMILLVQDTDHYVRCEVLSRIQKNLSSDAIPYKFVNLMFFMNNEPIKDTKFSVEAWLKSTARRLESKKDVRLEKSLARLIHLISHDDKFTSYIESEPYSAYSYALDILLFYFKSIISSENISLLYYVASRVKQFRDACISPSFYEATTLPQTSKNMYCVAELTQLIIKDVSESRNWSTLSWPGKIQLPNDIFTPIVDTTEAHDIVSTVYIPDDLQVKLRVYIKQNFSSTNGKKRSYTTVVYGKKTKPKKARVSKRPRVTADVEPTRKSTRSRKEISYGDYSECDILDSSDDE